MANIRQYIGARYVIKIYENSQDPSSAEWEQGNFEPLVMVTWQNGSYLSKKEVPGTIGNPASNPSYWVQTGFYNGQIAALQQQIDTINNTDLPNIDSAIQTLTNDIGTVENNLSLVTDRKYIFVGDSYGVDGGSGDERWITKTAQYMGLTLNTDYFVCAQGGIGFNTSGFLTALQSIASNITEPSKITDIVVCGGYNDNGQTYSSLVSDIAAFISYCKTTYQNAKIHIGENGWGVDETVQTNIVNNVMPAYHDGAIQNGECYIDNVFLTAHDYNNYVYNTGNYGIHPSDYTDMGMYIANYLKNGITHFYKRETNQLANVATAYRSNDSIAGGAYNITLNDDCATITLTAQLNLDGQTFTARSALPLFTFDAEKTIARINANLTTYCGMVTCLITAGGSVYNDYAFLQVISGKLVRLTPLVSRANVTSLLIQGIQLTIPSSAC